MARYQKYINADKFDSMMDKFERDIYDDINDTFLDLGELMTKFIKDYILMIYPNANTIKDPKKHKNTILQCVNFLYNRQEKILGLHALQTKDNYLFRILEGGTVKRETKGHKVTGYIARNGRLTRTGKGGYRGEITPKLMFKKGMEVLKGNIDTIINDLFEKNKKK